MTDIVFSGPKSAPLTVALAHGAGAPMDSPYMDAFAEGLAARGLRCARFEFPYMAQRRDDGKKRPPNPARVLLATWRAVIDEIGRDNLVIGGKSMGGRMASMVAADLESEGTPVRGVVCLGYPFHPPGKPDKLRTEHLETLKTKTLICQGTRDPFGTEAEVPEYPLSKAIRLMWLADGDHGFKPRKASGRTEAENWDAALDAIQAFCAKL
ncbi:MAG TPA: alpha/beta hydrolase [Rhodospirillaceae bacterium]|nr:alpha/beta hydrolase [Rhodospirillaceae bacterium]|tara:strand:- start:514 stop:1143 length:630 start_codon:yes stop_codon:yes gene_type:complete